MFKLTGKCKDRALRLPSEHDMCIFTGTGGMMLNILDRSEILGATLFFSSNFLKTLFDNVACFA